MRRKEGWGDPGKRTHMYKGPEAELGLGGRRGKIIPAEVALVCGWWAGQ